MNQFGNSNPYGSAGKQYNRQWQGARNQFADAIDDTNFGDNNFATSRAKDAGSSVGVTAPGPWLQKKITEGFAEAGAPVLGLVNYLAGEEPYVRVKDRKPSAITPGDGFDIDKMPPKKGKKKNTRKPRGKKKGTRKRPSYPRPGKRGAKSKGGRQVTFGEGTTFAAAAAYGNTYKGSGVTFDRPRNLNCMRMRVRGFVGTMQNSSGGLPQISVTNLTGTSLVSQWYFNAANTYYVSACPAFLIASYFQKYYINGMRLLFYAKQPTNTPGSIIVGTMDDPCFLETSGVGSASTAPSKLIVSEMYKACTYPIWEPRFVVPFKTDPKHMYYVRGPDGSNAIYNYGDNGADQRNSYSHCMGFSYDAVAVSTITHDIYIEADLELCELAAAFTNGVTKMTPYAQLQERLDRLEGKEVKKLPRTSLLDHHRKILSLAAPEGPEEDEVIISPPNPAYRSILSPIAKPTKSSSNK